MPLPLTVSGLGTMTSHAPHHETDHDECGQGHRDPTSEHGLEMRVGPTGDVPEEHDGDAPTDASKGVVGEKLPVRHLDGAGKSRHHRAEERSPAAEEHRETAPPAQEVLGAGELGTAFVEHSRGQDATAEMTADLVADAVADDRR